MPPRIFEIASKSTRRSRKILQTIILIAILGLLLVLVFGIALTFRLVRRLDLRLAGLPKAVDTIAPFIWSTAALNRTKELNHPLPNWNSWSMPPDTLVQILELIEAQDPRIIVEFGSGISTIAIASKIHGKGARLISYEHDANYAEHIRSMLELRDLCDVVDLRVVPMTDKNYMNYEHPWYAIDPQALPTEADLVIVDGPPRPFGEMVRLPAGDLMAQRLAPGGTILFDDAARSGEQAIKRFLKEKYPQFAYVEPPSIRGCLLMTRAD